MSFVSFLLTLINNSYLFGFSGFSCFRMVFVPVTLL